MTEDGLLNNLLQELKRGTVTLSVLLMSEKPAYGYSLVTDLKNAGVEVDQNTLYPLLRRLETQGMLESSWNTDDSRPRKYYSRTDEGRRIAGLLGAEWQRLNSAVARIIKEEGSE